MDKFAQKSFECFHGFIEIYTWVTVEHKTQDPESRRIRTEKRIERQQIAEMILKIPKGQYDPAVLEMPTYREETVIQADGKRPFGQIVKKNVFFFYSRYRRPKTFVANFRR